MRKSTLICFVLLVWLIKPSNAQTYSPLELAKRIFDTATFVDIDRYSMGEYQGHPNGQDILNEAKREFEVLEINDQEAVIAMTLLTDADNGLDTYLFFEKDTIWKMSAFRALAMTGMIEQMRDEMEALTPAQIDEMIARVDSAGLADDVGINSREDFEFQLGNANLILDLDRNIIAHFKQNEEAFERLKDLAYQKIENDTIDKDRRVDVLPGSRSEYRKLFISSINYNDYQVGKNLLSFSIGGMLDNTVGYLHVKDKASLPKMTDRRVIMLKEIGNGWYLYKTT